MTAPEISKEVAVKHSYVELAAIYDDVMNGVAGQFYAFKLSSGIIEIHHEHSRDGNYASIRLDDEYLYKLESQDFGAFLGEPQPVGRFKTAAEALNYILILELKESEAYKETINTSKAFLFDFLEILGATIAFFVAVICALAYCWTPGIGGIESFILLFNVFATAWLLCVLITRK